MRLLLTADWHLTDRPEDEYRWSIFQTCKDLVMKHGVDRIINIGDVTHFKDGHRAPFTNRIVREFASLAKICPVDIVTGNHDYVDRRWTFFQFLSHVQGVEWYNLMSSVEWVRKKEENVWRVGFFPHIHDPIEEWEGVDWKVFDLVFIHQCLLGAELNGISLQGFDPKFFEGKVHNSCQIFAGDIHDPQKVGRVQYTGSPHPVNFGDNYKTQVLLWEDGKVTPISVKSIRKVSSVISSLDELANYDADPGDQIKIEYLLQRADLPMWPELREEVLAICKEVGLHVYGCEMRIRDRVRLKMGEQQQGRLTSTSPSSLLKEYIKRHQVDSVYEEAGLELIARIR